MQRVTSRVASVVNSEFDVWLARDLLFNVMSERRIKKFVKYTKCLKVKYSAKDERYLNKMELSDVLHGRKDRAVVIKLDGKIRYVWRSDVLTKKEFENAKKKQQHNLGLLCKNRERVVDQ